MRSVQHDPYETIKVGQKGPANTVSAAEPKWRVLVAHPGRQHSHQAALALHEAGNLGCYATGIPVSKRQFSRVGQRVLGNYSVYDDVSLPLKLIRLNMAASVVNRLAARHLPEYIVGPMVYESLRMFDRWAAKLLKSERFDAVVAYENSALYTFEAAKKVGAACILDAASLHRVEQDRQYKSGLPRAYKGRVDRLKDRELSLADCVFTASDLAARSYALNTNLGSRIKTILLGANIDCFKPAGTALLDGKLREPFVFAFVGSATAKKGFDLILNSLEALISEGLSVELLVAGRIDPRMLSARTALRGKIREYGIVSQSALSSILTSAGCLLLPSFFDSFGMVVVEGMACGLPVIVSDMVGAGQLVEEGRNGFVVPVGNGVALTNKMRWCLRNPDALARMSVAARATAEQMSWANYRNHFAAEVREVMSGFKWLTSAASCSK
jgi:glycosyltransferase involved in cell wall biosynthesis